MLLYETNSSIRSVLIIRPYFVFIILTILFAFLDATYNFLYAYHLPIYMYII